MSSRKRRRSLAFPIEAEIVIVEDSNEPDEAARVEKDMSVWDSFREEHYEVVEQMPLTLHRQYALLRELDQQAQQYTVDLLARLKEYTEKRVELSLRPREDKLKTLKADANLSYPVNARYPAMSPHPSNSMADREEATSSSPVHPSVSQSSLSKFQLFTTRHLLSHIAFLSDELVRTSQDKASLALAAHDTVDRHLRILDQAIKDEETSLIHGLRPGHLAQDSLSDLTVTRWAKPTRVSLSPVDEDPMRVLKLDEEEMTSKHAIAATPSRTKHKQGKLQGQGRSKIAGEPVGRGTTALTITLPAAALTEASEEKYCYCNGTGHGTMIGCDNPKCEREWFHLPCLNYSEPPEGSWYCPECRKKRKRR